MMQRVEKMGGGREDLGAFLCFMAVRLIEMRRILKPTGSIYLHCDPTASHYLKALMDAIFGDKNFRNEIVWAYTGPGSPKMRQFNRKHDIILWYSKGAKWTFNRDAVRMPYVNGKPNTGGFKHADGSNMDAKVAANYGATKGKIPETWWTDIAVAVRSAKERVGYPTQKPLKLYERIIKASSNPGDVVLDPFCGCATTPIAAERLGREWIGMDLWDGAYDIVNKRMEDNKQLLADSNPQIILRGVDDIPVRTDGGEDNPTFDLELRVQRPLQLWERLTHKEMREILYEAQGGVCGGCGIALPLRYMELDHIQPRADRGANDITNRILICSPCNRAKSHRYTLSGLVVLNRKEGWTYDADAAKRASDGAWARTQKIKETGII